MRTTAAVFTILIGALLFGYFLTITQAPQKLTDGPGLAPGDSPEEARASLNQLADHDEEVVERVASVLGLSSAQFPVDETFWAARKLLEAMADRQPVVVVFEDIHWAELTFLDLIEHLLRSGEGPMLVVCLARPLGRSAPGDVGYARAALGR